MNEIIQAMEERRSIRKFKAEMPPMSQIEEIVEAGLYAASARGKQSAIIVAITSFPKPYRIGILPRYSM